MTCDSTKKRLSLYLYGELSFEDEDGVAEHLTGCEECREELERERRMHEAADELELLPETELLERCRLELPRTLRRARSRRRSGWMERLAGLIGAGSAVSPVWLRPVGAVALVALGFFAARYTSPRVVVPEGAGAAGDPVAVQVRYVEPAGPSGVRIVLDETRQRVISGSLEDQAIQRMLLTAVRNPSDPGVRAESMELLQNRPESEEVRNALLYALEHDPNDGVRLRALEGLRNYSSDPETRRVLSRVLLTDDNPGIRSMSIDLLVRSQEEDVVTTLQEMLRREQNSYLRMQGEKALEEMNATVETF